MKKYLLVRICIAAAFLFVFACKKDEPGQTTISLDEQKISAKWIIDKGGSDIRSIEFTKEGKYIVETSTKSNASSRTSAQQPPSFLLHWKKGPSPGQYSRSASQLSPIHFGTYKIDGNKIKLIGFGLIEEITVTAESFTFSFALEQTSSKTHYVASKKAVTISNTAQTGMLCRTWVIDRFSIDISKVSASEVKYFISLYGDDWQAKIEKEYTDEAKGTIALFSRSGTYMLLDPRQEGENVALAEWKWANAQERSFYYSWENWADDWDDYSVDVVELNNSSLKINEAGLIVHLTIKQDL